MDLEYKRNLFLLLNAYYSEFTSFFLGGKGSAFWQMSSVTAKTM